MAASRVDALPSLTGTGANAGTQVSSLDTKALWVVGTFVATVQAQVSPDGTNWVNEGAALTAPGYVTLPAAALYVQLNCTAYTSGTVESLVVGTATFPA